jgi:hypothetical protein
MPHDYTKVYQGLRAVQAYMANMMELHAANKYSIEDCPNCGRVSCRITLDGSPVIHWVDTVKRADPDNAFFDKQTMACVSWCSTVGGVKYDRQEYHNDAMIGKWVDDTAPETDERQLCNCELQVLARVGCQCGGK